MTHVPSYHWVFDCVHQADDVGPSSQVLQDLYFSLDLLLLDRLIGQEKPNKTKKRHRFNRGFFLGYETWKKKQRRFSVCCF